MSKSPRLSNRRAALGQCLVGIAETNQDDPQECLRYYLGIDSGLIDKQAMGIWIIKRKHLFEMRSGRS